MLREVEKNVPDGFEVCVHVDPIRAAPNMLH